MKAEQIEAGWLCITFVKNRGVLMITSFIVHYPANRYKHNCVIIRVPTKTSQRRLLCFPQARFSGVDGP